jgi:hypothetical protein
MLEKSEEAIKNGESRDIGSTGNTTQDEDKQNKLTLEKIERAIKNGESRDIGSTGNTTEDEDKQNTLQKAKKLSNTDL